MLYLLLFRDIFLGLPSIPFSSLRKIAIAYCGNETVESASFQRVGRMLRIVAIDVDGDFSCVAVNNDINHFFGHALQWLHPYIMLVNMFPVPQI